MAAVERPGGRRCAAPAPGPVPDGHLDANRNVNRTRLHWDAAAAPAAAHWNVLGNERSRGLPATVDRAHGGVSGASRGGDTGRLAPALPLSGSAGAAAIPDSSPVSRPVSKRGSIPASTPGSKEEKTGSSGSAPS